MCYEMGWPRKLREAWSKRTQQDTAQQVKTQPEPVPPTKPATTEPKVKERDPVSA